MLITGGTSRGPMNPLQFSAINRIIWNGRAASEYSCGAQRKRGGSRHKANPNGKLYTLGLILQLGHSLSSAPDSITYYKCDVSKWEEVEAISKKVVEEVSIHWLYHRPPNLQLCLGWLPDYSCEQRWRGPREVDP